jgi:hypothetical protein
MKLLSRIFLILISFEFTFSDYQIVHAQDIEVEDSETDFCDIYEGDAYADLGIEGDKRKIIEAAIEDYIEKVTKLSKEPQNEFGNGLPEGMKFVSTPLKMDDCEAKKLRNEYDLIKLMGKYPQSKADREKLKEENKDDGVGSNFIFELDDLAGIEYAYYADTCQLPAKGVNAKKEELKGKVSDKILNEMFSDANEPDALFLYSKYNEKTFKDYAFSGYESYDATPSIWKQYFHPVNAQIENVHGGKDYLTSGNWETNKLNKLKKRKMAGKVYRSKEFIFEDEPYDVDIESSSIKLTKAVTGVAWDVIPMFDDEKIADFWSYENTNGKILEKIKELSKNPASFLGGKNAKIVGVHCEGSASTLYTAFKDANYKGQKYSGNLGLAQLRARTCMDATKKALESAYADSSLKKLFRGGVFKYNNSIENKDTHLGDFWKEAEKNIDSQENTILTGKYEYQEPYKGTNGPKDWRCKFDKWMGEPTYKKYCDEIFSKEYPAGIDDALKAYFTSAFPDKKFTNLTKEATVAEIQKIHLHKFVYKNSTYNKANQNVTIGDLFYKPYQQAQLNLIVQYEVSEEKPEVHLSWLKKPCIPFLVAKFLFFKEKKDSSTGGGSAKIKRKKRKKVARYLNCKTKAKKKNECKPFKNKFNLCRAINKMIFGLK